MKPDDFVHLHVHSDLSNLDGCGKIADYVSEAKRRGHRAVAITDHGTMRGYLSQHNACEEEGIKPIYGLEFYVSPDMRRRGLSASEKEAIAKGLPKSEQRKAIQEHEERVGIRDRWHLTVWALDQTGLQNLYRLSSAAWIEGFYYKPRIDVEELIKYGDGLAVASGCLSSPINDQWNHGRRKAAMAFADRLAEEFGDRFYLEVQPHAIDEQRDANRLAIKLRERYGSEGVRLLATQDAHYVNRSDAPHHGVLLCIGTNDHLDNPDRFKFDGDEFYFKMRKEMFASFRRNHEFMPLQLVKEALDTTLDFADRATAKVEVDYHKALLPDPGIPAKYEGDAFAYLKDLCLDGWRWREIPSRARAYAAAREIGEGAALKVYRDRLLYELGALKRQKFVPYFLMVHDIYRFAREARIMVGPGRGSVAGSLVAYCLGLTSVDPIEFGLIFERFINPNRVDMPDVDMDFEDRRRHEVIEYLIRKYGDDKVCQIATIGKMTGKSCIQAVSRVLRVPLNEVNQVTASIIERSSGDERASQTIEDSFKDFAVCRAFDKKYPEVLQHAKRLEGMAKNLGIHAAGVIASPVPLTDLIPLEVRKSGDVATKVSAVDMHGVGAAGLVKLDVLGLRTLTVIKEALEAIEERHGRRIDLESRDIDLNDPKVLQGFTDHDFGGVFQYDTTSAAAVCRGVKFERFEDVAALTALNRPGTSRSGLATKYVERKKDPSLVAKVDFHPKVTEITSDTLGIIVYQEHVIRIFTDIAGFAPGTADSLRKTIAKKVGDETIGKERENFLRGAREHSGIDEKTADKIMSAITFFGCVERSTLVATPYGAKRIDELEVGDPIWSVGHFGQYVVNRVKAVGPSGIKRGRRVSANGVSVVASDGHFWLTRNGWEKSSELSRSKSRLHFVKKGISSATFDSNVERVDVAFETFDLECERGGEFANYFVSNQPENGWLVSHNSYGFNKTVGRSAIVHKAGANAVDRRKTVTIGELADRWGERSPMGDKLRSGRFRIVQMDEDGRCRPARLVGVYDHGVRRVYQLATKGGLKTPKISRSHRLMTTEGYKSIATGLGPGDRLLFMGENTGKDYCSWWAGGDPLRGFAQRGRQTDEYRAACDSVWKRDRDRCTECGVGVERGRGGGEVAHVRTPAECDYNRALFHSVANLRLLCNSCHKRLDYEKGERTKRWGKGRPTFADEVVEIIDAGEEHCFDLEVDSPGHNFVAGPDEETPPVVSHNSHATAYGVIAFWGMWLKTYYPIEFYWALMKNEPDRLRVQQFAKDAKRHGIALLPPHVNVSSASFAIDDAKTAIRGSLVDIKGVGAGAARAVVECQPYRSLIDFADRVDRRRCHRGVVSALAQAGALEGMLPNDRHFIENTDRWWKALTAKRRKTALGELVAEAKAAPEWPSEERELVASKINPLAFGRHPILAHKKTFGKVLAVPFTTMEEEDFFKRFDNRGIFVIGMMVETKYNQIGDFHTGPAPSEAEKRRMFWGRRYANINVEDETGTQNRFKVDHHIFDGHRAAIDKGVGTPLIVHASPMAFTGTLRANFVVDVEGLRAKLRAKEALDVWERIVVGRHPAKEYVWATERIAKERVLNSGFKSDGGHFTGVVTHVQPKFDRKGNLMAYLGLLGASGRFLRVVIFSSVWERVRDKLKRGLLVRMELERKKDKHGWSNFYDGGKLSLHRRFPAKPSPTE